MDDLIKREDAIEIIAKTARENFSFGDHFEHILTLLKSADSGIRQIPAVDAVEVVRCRNCIYADEHFQCKYVQFNNWASDYCARGKRRDDIARGTGADIGNAAQDVLMPAT